MTLVEQTKLWCQELNLRPSKSLGQNFLISEKILSQILNLAALDSSATVLEIGPGLGILTKEILSQAGKVVAVEKDPRLVNFLRRRLSARANLNLIEADALTWNPTATELSSAPYQIIANLPYSITGAFLTRFLKQAHPPTRMILMLQKEVAAKLCAAAGEMSLLAVLVQFYAHPKIAFKVPRCNFWPQPAVDSVIIELLWQPLAEPATLRAAWSLVAAGFSSPRKKLINNLSAAFPASDWPTLWRRLDWSDGLRAEDLSAPDWLDLWRATK